MRIPYLESNYQFWLTDPFLAYHNLEGEKLIIVLKEKSRVLTPFVTVVSQQRQIHWHFSVRNEGKIIARAVFFIQLV